MAWRKIFLWSLLSLPAIAMLASLAFDNGRIEVLIHVSGEFAARFLILVLMITPLSKLLPTASWLRWLIRQRRAFGVTAFTYALLHTLSYIADIEPLELILAEFWALGIWTGWLVLLIFLPLALTSNNYGVRRLRQWWKPLHRLVYAAAILTLLHWLFVHNNFTAALIHFIPLGLLQAYRISHWLSATNRKSI
jgi:methionine sulfoxide reductase heme-binding subunit